MHVLRAPFRMEESEAVAFAADRGFGIVVAADRDGPRGSHVPFVILPHRDGVVVQVHFTAENPLVGLADGSTRFLLIVTGRDAYVSNDWYVSPDQVSTWLYEAVHLSGVARRRGMDENRRHGDALLAASEARLDPKVPWSLDRMEPARREGMLGAIRVVDIAVDRVEGQRKLNQHKPDHDHVAVATRLARETDTGSQELARTMRALRPHLDYGP